MGKLGDNTPQLNTVLPVRLRRDDKDKIQSGMKKSEQKF